MLVTVFGTIMAIMVAGAAMDLGLYYMDIQRANEVAGIGQDMAMKLRSSYLVIENYGTLVEQQIKQYAEGNGLKAEGLYLDVRINLLEGNEIGTKSIDCIYDFRYTDSYSCIFLPLIGINRLPVNVSRYESIIYMDVPVWQPGDPFVDWYPEET